MWFQKKNFGSNRFSRFDVYWTQTNKQTGQSINIIAETDSTKHMTLKLQLLVMYKKEKNFFIYLNLHALDSINVNSFKRPQLKKREHFKKNIYNIFY